MKDRNWIVVKLRKKYQFLTRIRCKLLEFSMWVLGFDCKFKGFFIPKEQPTPPTMHNCRTKIIAKQVRLDQIHMVETPVDKNCMIKKEDKDGNI